MTQIEEKTTQDSVNESDETGISGSDECVEYEHDFGNGQVVTIRENRNDQEQLLNSSHKNMYSMATIEGIDIYEHEVIFVVTHGRGIKPNMFIRHINNNPLDNSPRNLMEVSNGSTLVLGYDDEVEIFNRAKKKLEKEPMTPKEKIIIRDLMGQLSGDEVKLINDILDHGKLSPLQMKSFERLMLKQKKVIDENANVTDVTSTEFTDDDTPVIMSIFNRLTQEERNIVNKMLKGPKLNSEERKSIQMVCGGMELTDEYKVKVKSVLEDLTKLTHDERKLIYKLFKRDKVTQKETDTFKNMMDSKLTRQLLDTRKDSEKIFHNVQKHKRFIQRNFPDVYQVLVDNNKI